MGHPSAFLVKPCMCPWRLKDHGWKEEERAVRWDVFIPCFLVISGAAILGVVNNAWLTKVTSAIFGWSLETFGWLLSMGRFRDVCCSSLQSWHFLP